MTMSSLSSEPGALSTAELMREEIRALMGRRRVSQRELARRVGRPAGTVNKWLSGAVVLTFDDLDSMAAALGVTSLDLFDATLRAQTPERRPAPVRTGRRSGRLPQLDLNQQPFGFRKALVRLGLGSRDGNVYDLDLVREDRETRLAEVNHVTRLSFTGSSDVCDPKTGTAF